MRHDREDKQVKKQIFDYMILFVIICISFTSCSNTASVSTLPNQDSYARLNDISPEKISERKLNVTGEIRDVQFADFGILVSSANKPVKNVQYIAFFDSNYQKIWEVKATLTFNRIKLFTKELTVIDTGEKLVAYNYKGDNLWNADSLGDIDSAYFPDHYGGVFALVPDYTRSPSACMQCHISNTGKLEETKNYEGIGDFSPLRSYIVNQEKWLCGELDTNKRFLAKLSDDLKVEQIFTLKENQYPNVAFDYEKDRIILFGQAYEDNHEYGFIYTLDTDCRQKAYQTFDLVPCSLVVLKSEELAVSFYDRSNMIKSHLRIFNTALKEIKTISIDFGFTELFRCEDGGFAVSGGRLSPGQPYSALVTDSVQPDMDRIVARYNSKHTLLSRKNYLDKNSYNYFVTDDGTVLIS